MGKITLIQLIQTVEEAGRSLLKLQPQIVKLFKNKMETRGFQSFILKNFFLKNLNVITPAVPVLIGKPDPKISLCWALNPLDGVNNYFQGKDFWTISLSLVKNSQVLLGLVYFPAFDQAIALSRDGRVVVSKGIRLKVRYDNRIVFLKGKVIPFELGIRTHIKKCDCVSGALWEVAVGKIAGFVHFSPIREEIGAGCLAVEKARGRVTDFEGNPWTPFSDNLVASNGYIHDKLLSVLPREKKM